jgi:hypothetical protein
LFNPQDIDNKFHFPYPRDPLHLAPEEAR